MYPVRISLRSRYGVEPWLSTLSTLSATVSHCRPPVGPLSALLSADSDSDPVVPVDNCQSTVNALSATVGPGLTVTCYGTVSTVDPPCRPLSTAVNAVNACRTCVQITPNVYKSLPNTHNHPPTHPCGCVCVAVWSVSLSGGPVWSPALTKTTVDNCRLCQPGS